MPNLLLRQLVAWVGPETAQAEFEAKGFTVVRQWQERVIESCGQTHAAEIHKYWNELSREIVCSAGKCSPETRKFSVEPGYRSSYLDELAVKKDFEDPQLRYAPLLKCLYEYVREQRSDMNSVLDEVALFEALKAKEAAGFSISAPDEWTGRKRDMLRFTKRFGEARGFALTKKGGHRFSKKSTVDIVFEFGVDLGGNPNCLGRLPLYFHIFHAKEPDFIFNIILFDRIVPGFDKYAFCKSPIDYVMSAYAHIEFFETLFHSFEHRS